MFSLLFKVMRRTIDGFRPDFSALYEYVERDLDNSTAVSGIFFLRHLLAQPLALLRQLGRQVFAKIRCLK